MSAPVATPTSRSAASSSTSTPVASDQPAGMSAGLVGFNGIRRVPPPVNEPVRSYAPGSAERVALKARLHAMATERIEIPIVIGGEEFRTGEIGHSVMPHAHGHVLADWHKATPKLVEQAVAAAKKA